MPACGKISATSVTAPMTSSSNPSSERQMCGGSWKPAARRAAGARRRVERAPVLARRRSATTASDLDDDGEDHRPSLRALVEVLRQPILDLRLEQADLAGVVARVLDRRPD